MVSTIERQGNGIETVFEDSFSRILNGHIYDNEEIRKLQTLDYEYLGLASANADISTPLWSVVRKTWLLGKCVRFQYRANVAWSQVDQGWL